ncbi:hypothetical protein [Adhaeribacter radiodurans]|uniref:STAS/SEC14 domain-containing protein n=1 Tax=Adhaeribacter radiodurans TaxID=2745197 RepID=A0A7L7L5T6_9BACT|nr:hypothetical protein [Adhaeribacter radiodurans]QMU28140.1 hypothetical protein HUW48_08820 [Adhaeribacter radiodurans]
MIIIDRIKNTIGEVYAVLSYEPLKNYLMIKWFGHCTDEEVKAASLRMLDWQRKEGKRKDCKFHVHDTKEIEGAWSGLVDWINNELFPMGFEAGLRYNISILSPDLFSKLSSQALYHKKNTKVPTILCETISQAERWLTEKYKEL